MFPEAAEQDCWVGTGPRVGTDKLTVVGEQGLGDLRERRRRREREKRQRWKKREEIRRREIGKVGSTMDSN